MRPIHSTAVILPFFLAIAACSERAPKAVVGQASSMPAHADFIVDVSSSPAVTRDPMIAQAAERRVGADVAREIQLGDTITVYETGARSAERMVSHPPIVTDYNLRVAAAQAQLAEQLRGIVKTAQAQGGDNATNLLLTLEAIRPDCTPRSTVTFLSDGVEEGSYSAAKALADGKPVQLPSPPGKYLAGCRIRFLGFGLTSDLSAGKPELLPAAQLAALKQGWTTYLEAAGVQPDHIEFVSVL